MGRILFFVLIFAVIYLGWRSIRMRQIRLEEKVRNLQHKPANQTSAEPMVRCAHCGVYVPIGEAIESGGDFYCCQDHRRAGPSQRP